MFWTLSGSSTKQQNKTFGFSISARAGMLGFQKKKHNNWLLVLQFGPVCACWIFKQHGHLVFHSGFTRASSTLRIMKFWLFISGPHEGKFKQKMTSGFSFGARAGILGIQKHVVFICCLSCQKMLIVEQHAVVVVFLMVLQYFVTRQHSSLNVGCAQRCFMDMCVLL